ncbi:MAG TPA: NAD(+)--arginine ADP-ribosyltransferase [Mycobacterium sp.]|nr:NAD(+)--arginine ADP-ribosyltransferase [Mycobacterium sp.]
MAPLAVDPAALDGAGATVVTAGEGLSSAISILTVALSGCAGMAGDDPAGAALGHSYDSSASKLVKAMVATRNGLCSIGDGVRMSAHNYSLAEAQSNITGPGSPLPTPQSTGPVSAASAPSSVGTSDGAPPGWGWVAPYIGMIWPTADSAKLRAAATAWSAAGTQFGLAEILGTGAPMGAIRAQQIPEGPAIDRAFTEAYRSTTGVVQQSQKIVAQLNSFAAKVDKVHAAILDLLARICDPMTGIKEVWDILTDEDEDEIKKIADDIRTVVENFSAEVAALQQQIASTLAEAETILTAMGNYAERDWDQFLHGTEVGRAINQVGQYAKGIWSEAGGFVKGLYDISQVRLLFDPVGYYRDLGQMVQGAAPLVGLGPDGGPGVGESWKTLGKGVSHWDEWKTNPAEALGRTVFDVGTLALPGGPLSKLPKMSRAAADALKGLKPPRVPKLPEPQVAKPPETPQPPPAPEPAPGGKPPEPGSPAPPKPGPAPTGTPPPHSPAEPKSPVAPPGSAGKPSVAAESTPVPHPQPHESVPARMPVSPGGSPGEPVPAAAAPAASAPAASMPSASAPSAPHLPSPPSVPMGGGAPAEAPLPHGGTPHAGEPGAHEPHRPHDGAPRPPGDGSPHEPGDGSGHPPTDGTPHEPGDGSPGDNHPPTEPGDPGRPEFTLDNPLDHMSHQLLALSEQHLTGSGETVLGPFKPRGGGLSYIDFAELHRASYFDIGDAWESATPIERLAANQHVLDIAIARGDTVTLSVPFGKIDPNSFTGAEIRYLESHGYHRAGNDKLIPPSKGG